MSSFKSHFYGWFQATKRSIFNRQAANTDIHSDAYKRRDEDPPSSLSYSNENMSDTPAPGRVAKPMSTKRGERPERLHNPLSKNPFLSVRAEPKETPSPKTREQSGSLAETPGPTTQDVVEHERSQGNGEEDAVDGNAVTMGPVELEKELHDLEEMLEEFEREVDLRKQLDEADFLDMEDETFKAECDAWDLEIINQFFMVDGRLDANMLKHVLHRLDTYAGRASSNITSILKSISPTPSEESKQNYDELFKDYKILPASLLAYLHASHDHPSYYMWMTVAMHAVWAWCNGGHTEAWTVGDEQSDNILRTIFSGMRESDAPSAFVWRRVTYPQIRDILDAADPDDFVVNLWKATNAVLAYCGWNMDSVRESYPSLESDVDILFRRMVAATLDMRDSITHGFKGHKFLKVKWFETETTYDSSCMQIEARTPLMQGPILCTTAVGLVIDFTLLDPDSPKEVPIRELKPRVVVGDFAKIRK